MSIVKGKNGRLFFDGQEMDPKCMTLNLSGDLTDDPKRWHGLLLDSNHVPVGEIILYMPPPIDKEIDLICRFKATKGEGA